MANVNEQLSTAFGGKENIKTIQSCVTRLRIVVKDKSTVNFDDLKNNVEGALGVVDAGEQIQVVFGPGVANIAESFSNYVGINSSESNEDSLEDIAKANKENTRIYFCL